MAKGPNDFPPSPDELAGGVRGRVGGVTRIGPRAFGIAFFVVCGLLVAILYGVNKQSDKPKNEALASPPPAIQTDEAHFGSNEPIVPTAAPATPPPPLVLPTNNVPDLDKQSATAAPAAAAPVVEQNAGPSADDQRLAAERAKEDQARLDEEKRRRELLAAALKSPILTGQGAAGGSNGAGPGSGVKLAFAGNGDASSGSEGGSGTGGASGVGSAGLVSRSTAENTQPQPSATQFLEGPTGQYKVNAANIALPNGASATDFLQADRFAPLSPFEITASSVIPAELITNLDSELPGLISAQIREDVYDTKTGRYMLIPRGSRLIGLYKSSLAYGQSRVLIAWQRLIFPDTTSIDLLNMGAADVEGGAGLGGQVDNHYGKIFGAALLTSILAAGLQLSQPQQSATSSVFQTVTPGQAVSQAVGQQLSQTATQIISKDLNIPPTLHVAKGYPFLVFVDRDIVLPGPYRAQ